MLITRATVPEECTNVTLVEGIIHGYAPNLATGATILVCIIRDRLLYKLQLVSITQLLSIMLKF